jgi:glycosyltransferase involved in cell wall biosynthesis
MGIDVFHGPRFWVPPLRCPSVVTIHDCAFRIFPEVVAGRTRDMFDRYVRSSLSLCRKVIVPSEATRRDLVRLYSADESMIAVVPEAASREFQAYADRSAGKHICAGYGIEGPYILTVGTREPRKNFSLLLEAYSRLPGRSSIKLVVAGGRGWLTDSLKDTVRKLGLSRDVIFTGYVPTNELVWLYNCCESFVFPSLYEGFGLPVLEAMQCGAPVVSSGAGAVEEWFGGAFEPADPYDPESFARAVDSVLSDKSKREKLSRAGLEVAKKFSWSHTAEMTREVYRKAMGNI